jgi:lipopolysaccharide export system permease protein
VILFLIFNVISIMVEKSAKEGVLEPWLGAWLATLVLFPLGVFLTYKAAMDSALFDKDVYKRLWRKILWKAA